MSEQIPVFYVGARVRISPASDWFMRGVTYAVVTSIGRKWLHLRADTTGLVPAKFCILMSNANRHVLEVQNPADLG